VSPARAQLQVEPEVPRNPPEELLGAAQDAAWHGDVLSVPLPAYGTRVLSLAAG